MVHVMMGSSNDNRVQAYTRDVDACIRVYMEVSRVDIIGTLFMTGCEGRLRAVSTPFTFSVIGYGRAVGTTIGELHQVFSSWLDTLKERGYHLILWVCIVKEA